LSAPAIPYFKTLFGMEITVFSSMIAMAVPVVSKTVRYLFLMLEVPL